MPLSTFSFGRGISQGGFSFQSSGLLLPVINSVTPSTNSPMVNVPITLTVSASNYDSLEYHWYRRVGTFDVEVSTAASYSPVAADVGYALSVKVIGISAVQSSPTARATATLLMPDTGMATNLTLTAYAPGTAGNAVTCSYDSGGGTAALSLLVTGTAIAVTLATTAGVRTSTSADVQAALLANGSVMALLSNVTGGSVGVPVNPSVAGAAYSLTGGTDLAIGTTASLTNPVVSDLTTVLPAQGSLGTATNFSPTISPALDFSANRYVIEYSSAVWSTGPKAFGAHNASSTARFTLGNDVQVTSPPKFSLYVSDNSNVTRWEGTSTGSNAITSLAYDVARKMAIEAGMGQLHGILNDVPIFLKDGGTNDGQMGLNRYYRQATTVARPDPASITRHVSDSGITFGTLTIKKREWASIRKLVMLGNSITSSGTFEARIRSNLGATWFIDNNAEGSRQSREIRSAVLTPFPAGNNLGTPQRFYNDVGKYFCPSARRNIVLLHCTGTNDIRNYGLSGNAAPNSDCGGYTFTGAATNTDAINNIVQAIADVRTAATSAGVTAWVVVTTTLAMDGWAGGGAAYGTGSDGQGEAKRRALNTAILTGAIAAVADQVINLDTLFALGGACYNASYANLDSAATSYCRNTTYFSADKIHLNATGYNAVADYITPLLPS